MVVFSKKRGQEIFFDRSKSALDYYPFGMQMPGRKSNEEAYRYAFNGMETDKEVSGGGNSYTTQFRQYDPRLGRWKSLDPLAGKYPNQSPFAAFNNNPLYFTDPLGLEGEPQKGTKDNPHEVSNKEGAADVLDGLEPDKNGNIDDQYFKIGNDLYRAKYNQKTGWTYYKKNGSSKTGYSWVKGGTYKTETKSAPGSSTSTGGSRKPSGTTGTNTQKTSNPSNTGTNNNSTKTNYEFKHTTAEDMAKDATSFGYVIGLNELLRVNEFFFLDKQGRYHWNSALAEKSFKAAGLRTARTSAITRLTNVKMVGSALYIYGQVNASYNLMVGLTKSKLDISDEDRYVLVVKNSLDISINVVMYRAGLAGFIIGGIYYTIDNTIGVEKIVRETYPIYKEIKDAGDEFDRQADNAIEKGMDAWMKAWDPGF